MPDLKKLRESEPFRPLTLHLTSREILAVQHPELLSISPEVNDLFSLWVGREWNLVDVSTVSRVSVSTKAGKRT
jgi:hypothetical protein